MKAFCPNCGTDHEGMPGGRLTCRTCTASFEVPRERATQGPAPVDPTFIRPPSQPTAPPPAPSVVKPPPSLSGGAPVGPASAPSGYRGPPPTGFGRPQGSGQVNQLAIASIVLGVVCCIPFSSIGAIVTGVMARNQIAASNGAQRGTELATAGIILGVLSFFTSTVGLLVRLAGLLH